jgi:hypothetical protein
LESKKKVSRASLLAPAAAIVLGCALVGLLVSTFMLCSVMIQQFVPLILFAAFLPLAFFGMRMRWAKTRVWLFYTLCGVFAVACGFVIRALF